MTEVASKSSGFISSKSFFSEDIDYIKNNNLKIVTISEWDSKQAWNNWFNSKERKSVSEEFTDINREEKFNVLFEKKDNDIFLM